jgi:hypothetical protein
VVAEREDEVRDDPEGEQMDREPTTTGKIRAERDPDADGQPVDRGDGSRRPQAVERTAPRRRGLSA